MCLCVIRRVVGVYTAFLSLIFCVYILARVLFALHLNYCAALCEKRVVLEVEYRNENIYYMKNHRHHHRAVILAVYSVLPLSLSSARARSLAVHACFI